MRKHNLAFIDIETTGLDVIQHEIIEVGCVLVTPDLQLIEEFEIKIKPERIENADPVALKINHYNPEDWKDAVTLREAIHFIAQKVRDHIIVAQNAAFDVGFLEHAFSRLNLQNTMHYHKLDTISIAWAKLHKNLDFNRFSLHEMCTKFGIKNEHEHTALSDARATYELYKKLMQL